MTTLIYNQTKTTYSEKLFDFINPYSQLESRVKARATQTLLAPEENTRFQNDLQMVCKLATSKMWPGGRMKKILNGIPKEQLKALMAHLMETSTDEIIRHIGTLEQYLSLLDDEALLHYAELDANSASTQFNAQGLTKEYVLKSSLEREGRAIFKEGWMEIKYFFHHFLQILIALLGFDEMRETESYSYSREMTAYMAQNKLESYGKLIGYPGVLFALIYSFVQEKAIAAGITSLITGSVLASILIYHKYFRPCPIEYSGLDNLKKEVLRSKEPIYPQQDIIRKIENAFKQGKGVFLVGEPGCGKSSIPLALAEQIMENGLFSFMKSTPEIFGCPASQLKTQSLSLSSLKAKFKDHRDNVIFFFDEFHSLFEETQGGRMHDAKTEIKPFCSMFKYVIVATTDNEYREFMAKQTAIDGRRFIRIDMKEMDPETLNKALLKHLKRKSPDQGIEIGAIDYAIERAPEFNPQTARIDAAKSLLEQAAAEMDIEKPLEELRKKQMALQDEKMMIEEKVTQTKEQEATLTLLESLRKKNGEIQDVKKELLQKTKMISQIKRLHSYYLKLKRQSYRLAEGDIPLQSTPKKRKWILLQAKMKLTEHFIGLQKNRLSLPKNLNKRLIEEIMLQKELSSLDSRSQGGKC